MGTRVADFREKYHIPIWSLGPLVIALGGMFTYLQTNFASADDVSRIEQKIDVILASAKAQEIQSYMLAMCADKSNNAMVRQLQTLQEDYFHLTSHYHPWVCEVTR